VVACAGTEPAVPDQEGQAMKPWTWHGLAIDGLTIFAVFTLVLALLT
jgi:hypothetical protein